MGITAIGWNKYLRESVRKNTLRLGVGYFFYCLRVVFRKIFFTQLQLVSVNRKSYIFQHLSSLEKSVNFS